MKIFFLLFLVFGADWAAEGQVRIQDLIQKRSKAPPGVVAIAERKSEFSPEEFRLLTRRSEFDVSQNKGLSRRSEFSPEVLERLDRRSNLSEEQERRLQVRSGFSPQEARRVQIRSEALARWLGLDRVSEDEYFRAVSRFSQMSGDEIGRLLRRTEAGSLGQKLSRRSLWDASVRFIQKHSIPSDIERRAIQRRSGD